MATSSGKSQRSKLARKAVKGGPRRAGSVTTPSTALSTPHSRKVRVFISHAKADHVIAEALREEIVDLNRDRVECFLDTKTIESGEGWERKLESALLNADWLVCIYTGEQSEFCGYEVGVFTRGRALEEGEEHTRLVCLHDVQPFPGIFRSHQNRLVEYPPERLPSGETFDETGFYEQSDVAKFLSDFCKFDGLYLPGDGAEYQRQSQAFIRKAKVITEAFRISRGNDIRSDTPTQLGFEVIVFAKPGEALETIPANALVKGTYGTFSLFDMMPHLEGEQLPSMSWADIKTATKLPSTGYLPWIERLERDMLSAANRRALGEAEATFRGKNKTYRAILVRHVLHWNGTHKFGVVFVETLPRQFIGDQNTSMILAGLVVASRFRFAYLEQPERVAAWFDDGLSLHEFEAYYRQFLYDLERMRQESMELGLLDHTTFINSFGPGRRGVAEGFLATWKEARQKFEASLPPADVGVTAVTRPQIKQAILTFLREMTAENGRFLQVALEAYTDELKEELRKRPVGQIA
jgi:TIR domain